MELWSRREFASEQGAVHHILHEAPERFILAVSDGAQLTHHVPLAEMAGISLATVKDIERGAGHPSMKTVTRILEVLGLEMQFRIRSIE